MAKSEIIRAADGTITLKIIIPAVDIKPLWEGELVKAANNATVQGFRKGKAPMNLVEGSINKDRVKEEILQQLIPTTYSKALEEHNLKPIISPKIHVDSINDGEDWSYSAQVCEMPEVKLNDYKQKVKEITAKSKIIIPGQEPKEPDFNELMKTLLGSTEVNVAQVLIDSEVERMLSQLLDEIRKLGLSLDQYLSSSQKSVEDLKKDYSDKARNDLKLEFVLGKIADTEQITVEQKEIDEAILKASSEEEKSQLQSNIYLLASILRQQKTFDFLKKL